MVHVLVTGLLDDKFRLLKLKIQFWSYHTHSFKFHWTGLANFGIGLQRNHRMGLTIMAHRARHVLSYDILFSRSSHGTCIFELYKCFRGVLVVPKTGCSWQREMLHIIVHGSPIDTDTQRPTDRDQLTLDMLASKYIYWSSWKQPKEKSSSWLSCLSHKYHSNIENIF